MQHSTAYRDSIQRQQAVRAPAWRDCIAESLIPLAYALPEQLLIYKTPQSAAAITAVNAYCSTAINSNSSSSL